MNSAMQTVGWTLIHFVWQGAAVALVVAAALRLTERRSPNVRYLIACAGLVAMLAAPAATARLLWTAAGSPGFDAARAFDGARGFSRAIGSADRSKAANDLDARLKPRAPSTPRAPSITPLDAFQLDQLDRFVRGVTFVWLAGVVLLLARMAGGWWQVRRLHHHALATASSRW